MKRLIAAAVLVGACLGSAVTVQAIGSEREDTLRARLLSCAILDEARQRGIDVRQLPATRISCMNVTR